MGDITIENLAIIVENICGADPLKVTRARPVVEARVLLVQCLRAKGYTQQRVAELIGFPRITIQHYCAVFADAMKYNNIPGLLQKWERLKDILDL